MALAQREIETPWSASEAVNAILLAIPLAIPMSPLLLMRGNNFASLMELAVLFLFAYSIFCVVLEKDQVRVELILNSSFTRWALVYVASVLLLVFFIRMNTYKLYIPSLLVYGCLPIFIYPLMLKSIRQLLPAFFVAWLLSLGFSLYNIHLSSADFTQITPLHMMGLQKNLVGDVSETGALIALAYLMTRGKKTNALFGLVAVASLLVCFASSLCANARACMLSVPVSAMAIGLAQSKQLGFKKLLLGGALSVILLFGGIVLAPDEKVTQLTSTDEKSSVLARPRLWSMTIQYLLQNPLRPVGFHQEIVFKGTNEVLPNPCNFFLQEWIELGLWGAIAYTSMVVIGIAISFNACKLATQRQWNQIAFIGAAVLALQILRFLREVQDTCLIGKPYGMVLPVAWGISLFLSILLRRAAMKKQSL